MPLWQAHQSCEVSFLNCTVQSRCVQTALNARISPSAVRTTMPGLLPTLKMAAGLRRSAPAQPATTLCVAGSPLAGGIRKRETGYAIATAVDTNPTARSASRNMRRSKSDGARGGMVDLTAIDPRRLRDKGPDFHARVDDAAALPGESAITGFRSSSTISGTSAARRDT